MPKYFFQAIDETGKPVSGFVEAESVQRANTLLAERGQIPSKVIVAGSDTGGKRSGLFDIFSKIKATDLILYSKQMSTMIRAGVPIIRMFSVLESQSENKKLKKITGEILEDVREGRTLFEAFRKHPEAFSPLYCSMINAGEAGGSLPEVLDRLIYIIEHEHKVKSEIKAALTYPIIVLIFLAIAFIVLLTFVVPKFVDLFLRVGLELPLPTRICIFLNNIIFNYWYLILAILISGITAMVYYFRTDQGKFVRDHTVMRIPIVGPLFIKSAMSRFSSIFAILQSSGVAVLDSIKILSGTIGNVAISRDFDRLEDQLREGRGIAEPLKAAHYFTPMVVNMVAIGEESGNLDEMLRAVAEHYDVEVEYATQRLADAVGPVLTVGLAAVVGFFAFAIFLPMWDLIKMIQKH
ncbi:MAG: type II secretion system F family protein [Proteobacteria bacterium]|nr:type II secretion system F family protein [Pseudomonadota bacterium]